MDPVNAGASVIAFITLTFQTAKTVHDTLSSFKGAPKVVEDLIQDISSLSTVLNRLSQCAPTHISTTTSAKLNSHVSACLAHLALVNSQLQKLTASPSADRATRLWKTVKAVWKEKDIQQIRERIRDQSNQLNICLGLVQVEKDTSTSLALEKRATDIEKQTTNIERQTTNIEKQTTNIEEQTTNIEKQNTNLEKQITDIGKVLHEVLGGITKLDLRSQDNADLNSSCDPTTDSAARASSVVNEDVTKTCADLKESISRLTELASHDGSILDAEDAEQIVDDVVKIIESAKDRILAKLPTALLPTHEPSDERTTKRNLKLIESLVFSAPILAINKHVPRWPRNFTKLPSGMIISQKRSHEEIDLEDGTLTITTNKRRKRMSKKPPDDCYGDFHSGRDIIADILFRPSASSIAIRVSVTQGQLFDRSIQLMPLISVNPIISCDSEVFYIVQTDDLDKFRRMLQNGEATIRDHDEFGSGLIHYFQNSPKICGFLLNSGVDPDEVGPSGNALCDTNPEQIDPEVMILLLNEMVDPTINPQDDDYESVLNGALFNGTTETLDLLFRYSSPFLADMGYNQLFEMALNKPHITTFSYLLEKGADIRARYHLGRTCLHLFFDSFQTDTELNPYKRFQALCYLIEHGADIHAIDDYKTSVSMEAYSQWGATGDVWDAALVACGHDIPELRQQYPRVEYRVYNSWSAYTRYDFEMMWKGRKHLCPYYNELCPYYNDKRRPRYDLPVILEPEPQVSDGTSLPRSALLDYEDSCSDYFEDSSSEEEIEDQSENDLSRNFATQRDHSERVEEVGDGREISEHQQKPSPETQGKVNGSSSSTPSTLMSSTPGSQWRSIVLENPWVD